MVAPPMTTPSATVMTSLYHHGSRGAAEICSTLERVELQRLRQHFDAEVASLVQAGTSQLKLEVDQLKTMLQSTSSQLLQALGEKEQARNHREQSVLALEEAKKNTAAQEASMVGHIQSLEDALSKGAGLVSALANSVHAFQRHVLPTFKPSGFETGKSPPKVVLEAGEGKLLLEQLTRLENELTLLRVIVDAKNDTLILIRGKLKQENEELRAELQVAREMKQGTPQPVPAAHHDGGFEKHMLRQELQSLQELFNAEVKQLKAKLKMYETEEQQGQGRLFEVQKEIATLQEKLDSVEASRSFLEASLKEETTARSQLLCELFSLRKEHEKIKTELETLKLNQKFLVRQPRNGRIPPEKMDLMNTVNQLLVEVNQIKSEKVSLEEELKNQRRFQVRERVKQGVTTRDVEMAASNKVGDSELASRLARARLQHLGVLGNSRPSTPVYTESFSSTVRRTGHLSRLDLPTDTVLEDSAQSASCCLDRPRENLVACSGLYSRNLATKQV
ncbi:hypothetical protein O6H91_07G009900 [Diphasiastrum complanatum]|uniref:Uncharacterized protein n=1 Tax=Diphasiastrum complanatum TaxID=34168 RepID=A0ACC2D2G4_DIPCM|nr:hypothetical protein O6H91_07G009900 [Diphasiastrum complanatum]